MVTKRLSQLQRLSGVCFYGHTHLQLLFLQVSAGDHNMARFGNDVNNIHARMQLCTDVWRFVCTHVRMCDCLPVCLCLPLSLSFLRLSLSLSLPRSGSRSRSLSLSDRLTVSMSMTPWMYDCMHTCVHTCMQVCI